MSVYKTLADLEKRIEKSKPTGKYLTLKDGDNVVIRFRQELSEDGKNYDKEAGQAVLVPVHRSPVDFRKQARATYDLKEFDYKDWAEDQAAVDSKWRAKDHLLINVLVEDEDGRWVPKIFDQTLGKAHVAATLMEYAKEYNTITDRSYRFARRGAKLDTQYSLVPRDPSPMPKAHKENDLFDLEEVFPIVPYDKQEAFYLSVDDGDGVPKDELDKW